MVDWYVKLRPENLGIVMIMFAAVINSSLLVNEKEDTYPPCN